MRRSERVILHRTLSLPAIDVTRRFGIPVTTPARTLIDIAAVVTPDRVEDAFDDALRRGLFSRALLRARLAELGGKGRAGSALLRELLATRTVGEVPWTVLETKLLRVLKAGRLPDPVRQHEIKVNGRFIARPDFAYPQHMLVIEADSYRWHSDRRKFEYDRARRNELTALGWRVVHITWRQLSTDPDGVCRMVRRALHLER